MKSSDFLSTAALYCGTFLPPLSTRLSILFVVFLPGLFSILLPISVDDHTVHLDPVGSSIKSEGLTRTEISYTLGLLRKFCTAENFGPRTNIFGKIG